jgi:hypothetical protein
MIKSRCMLMRSTDHGQTWKWVSTIAVDPAVGTEGFGEAVICRVSQGPKAGRLISGQTWSTVARITSGVLTTHYMAIEETPLPS